MLNEIRNVSVKGPKLRRKNPVSLCSLRLFVVLIICVGPSTAPKGRRPGRPPAVDTPPVSKRFQTMITMVHSQISQHRYGTIFHNPIRKVEASDYHDIVKRPMDLKTIKARIKDGLISSSLEFQRDVYLMFANAMMYNRPGSEIYNMAEEVRLFICPGSGCV